MAQITIGRNTQSNIVVDAQYKTVSTNHATIFYDGGTYILQDHSTNGTYINGNQIHNTSSQIRQGDHITLGSQYVLNMNEVVSLLGGGRATQRRVDAPATQRYAPQVPAQPMNQQIDINVGNAECPNYNQELEREPANLHNFNWGAFWLTWIWGVCNGVWIALLCFIPFIGFIMQFVLGFKGNEWAWEQQKHSKSASDFESSQSSWATAGWVILLISLLIGIISGLAI